MPLYEYTKVCTSCGKEKGIDCCFYTPTESHCAACKSKAIKLKSAIKQRKKVSDLRREIKNLTKQLKNRGVNA